MARVTVEDCLEHVTNRFELVLLAAKRARQLERGTVEPKVDWANDKATVVALREIAAGVIEPESVLDQPPPETATEPEIDAATAALADSEAGSTSEATTDSEANDATDTATEETAVAPPDK